MSAFSALLVIFGVAGVYFIRRAINEKSSSDVCLAYLVIGGALILAVFAAALTAITG